MIARGEVSLTDQLAVGHSRTAILIGVILAFNALLLALLMMGDQTWRLDVKWVIILLIVDFLLLFQLMPLVYMLVKAFFPDGGFSLETIRRLHTYPLNLDAVKNTLIAAGVTMVFGTVIAFPLAWLVGRTNLYGRKFFRALFVLTYMVPPYVGAMAWLRLLNPNVGTVNQWLRALLHLSDAPGPLNVYSLPGMIWVLTSFYYPYAFITISRAMEKMDPSLEEASRISGASPLKTVFTVTLPMMLPSLISGALLVFVSAMSCYGIPSIIGSPGRVHTVTTRIVEYVSLGQQGLNDAIGMAVFLMLLAVIILFLSDVVLAKRQYITVSGKSMRPTLVELRRWRVPLTVLVSLFAVIVILIPFATILLTSFKIDVGKSAMQAGNFTLSNWETVFGRVETLNSLKNSLIFASVAATVGILIACTMSYLLQRTRIRGRKIPDFLITLGSGTPSVVIALGLIMTMKGNFGINIYNTAYIMIIAYLIKYLMMGMRTVVSAMSQIHVSLEESSQVFGASWSRTMLRITGPLIFPSIAAGWFLIFIPSFYELSMTTLLYSSTTKTIGFQLYEYWTFTSQPMSCAMAFGILLVVMLLNLILNRLTKGEFSI
jgi:iron(III) transport system permease protein